LIVLNGLIHPYWSAGFGLVWVIGRIIYGHGYAKNGVQGRMIGAIVFKFINKIEIFIKFLIIFNYTSYHT
jgi:hypothetical protein